jgi:outer membrane protein
LILQIFENLFKTKKIEKNAMKQFYKLVGMVMFGLSHLLFAGSLYQEGEAWHGIMGLEVAVRADPYKEVNNKILLLPHVIMRRGNFFIDGLQVGYHAIEGGYGRIDFFLSPRLLDGFDAQDSVFLSGMEDRDNSLDAGIATLWRQDTVEFNLSFVTDVLHKSEGKEVTASLGNAYLAGKMAIITPSIGLKWQSENLVDYYYGVKSVEAKANRPAYRGEATINYTTAVNATYLLSKRSTLFATLEYERFGDDIVDSPLLNKKQIINIFLGYGWQF